MEEFVSQSSLCWFLAGNAHDKSEAISSLHTQTSPAKVSLALPPSSPATWDPPPYEGNIIEDMAGAVWAVDQWTNERTIEAEARIRLQGDPISAVKKDEFVQRAYRYWHEFYKRNQDHFYKVG
jgi:hypothetical protein